MLLTSEGFLYVIRKLLCNTSFTQNVNICIRNDNTRIVFMESVDIGMARWYNQGTSVMGSILFEV